MYAALAREMTRILERRVRREEGRIEGMTMRLEAYESCKAEMWGKLLRVKTRPSGAIPFIHSPRKGCRRRIAAGRIFHPVLFAWLGRKYPPVCQTRIKDKQPRNGSKERAVNVGSIHPVRLNHWDPIIAGLEVWCSKDQKI